jgi:hypothetical protein
LGQSQCGVVGDGGCCWHSLLLIVVVVVGFPVCFVLLLNLKKNVLIQ